MYNLKLYKKIVQTSLSTSIIYSIKLLKLNQICYFENVFYEKQPKTATESLQYLPLSLN